MAENHAIQPTDAELEDRIDRTYRLLCRGLLKCDIKRHLIKAYGVCARTCENYLARARERLREEHGVDAVEHQADSFGFYKHLRANGSSDMVKLKAAERLDKLLGLEKPQKHSMTDPSGEREANISILIPDNGRDPQG